LLLLLALAAEQIVEQPGLTVLRARSAGGADKSGGEDLCAETGSCHRRNRWQINMLMVKAAGS
jgi:hypothetical protein